MVADLKFGDVIRFDFGGLPITAMVLATRGETVRTDEGTDALGDTGSILVLGLINSDPDDKSYHQVGETSEFHSERDDGNAKPFEVLP